MLYLLSAFILFIVFLSIQKDRRASIRYLLGTGLLYFAAVLFMILYLSKDVRYYNIIRNYFLLPEAAWKNLMFVPLSRNFILRALNLFSLSVVFMGCRFSLICTSHPVKSRPQKLLRLLGVFLLLEWILYDPLTEKFLYLLFYPNVMSAGSYELFLESAHLVTSFINHTAVVLSILNLFRPKNQIYSFPYFKYFAYGETAGYTLIMISYLILFGMLPVHPIRFSRFSGYTTYISLPLYDNNILYTIFPWYLLCATLTICLSIVMLSRFSRRVNAENFSISSRIDAANTTSKSFCHYMKNELLAIQAEIGLLDITEQNHEELAHINERCQNLYQRLDIIHRSTKASTLTLENTDLEALLRRTLSRMSVELSSFHVSVNRVGEIPSAFLDADYFEQAIHNLITNAIDAMSGLPYEQRNLTFTLRSLDQWIALSISDTGLGIRPQNLSHIFEPFFTSHPIAEHWGIGLTVTHQIIQAHKGRISVESKEGKGTTFQILLPDLRDYTKTALERKRKCLIH